MRDVIVSVLRERSDLTFTDLATMVEAQLRGQFDGSVMWYYTTVKLDLEARKMIKRVPNSSPQRLRLAR